MSHLHAIAIQIIRDTQGRPGGGVSHVSVTSFCHVFYAPILGNDLTIKKSI